jgi:hypothetical protein
MLNRAIAVMLVILAAGMGRDVEAAQLQGSQLPDHVRLDWVARL